MSTLRCFSLWRFLLIALALLLLSDYASAIRPTPSRSNIPSSFSARTTVGECSRRSERSYLWTVPVESENFPDPVLKQSCAEVTDCEACYKITGCHFCETDQKCHAIGSIHGCVWGYTCNTVDPCTRIDPEYVGVHAASGTQVLIILIISIGLGLVLMLMNYILIWGIPCLRDVSPAPMPRVQTIFVDADGRPIGVAPSDTGHIAMYSPRSSRGSRASVESTRGGYGGVVPATGTGTSMGTGASGFAPYTAYPQAHSGARMSSAGTGTGTGTRTGAGRDGSADGDRLGERWL